MQLFCQVLYKVKIMTKLFNPKTLEYIKTHKKNVLEKMSHCADILIKRGVEHDDSKLQDPEFSYWCLMDKEPRYPYGSKEYKRKMEKWKPLMKLHYSNPNNKHHPENFESFEDTVSRKDLFDLIEMICDWLAYKDKLTYKEASELVSEQCKRYNFSEELSNLILNTLGNNFVSFGGIDEVPNKKTSPKEPPGNLLNIIS